MLLVLLTGCAHKLTVLEENALLQGAELTATPFFPQDDYQCGPAALATVLSSSGESVQPDLLKKHVYLPKRKGSLQLELMAASRSFGRIPYPARTDLPSLAAELQAGHPVLVLQNFGTTSNPLYHYAAVVGLSSKEGVILRSGKTKRLTMPATRFLSTVRRASFWGLVTLQPGELPANGTLQELLEPLIALEATGHFLMAEKGYRALLARHPENSTILFGLANTLAASNRPAEAIKIYNKLLEKQPSHLPAINNLADTLAREHCYSHALQILERGLEQDSQDSEFSPVLQTTFREIAVRSERHDDVECTFPER